MTGPDDPRDDGPFDRDDRSDDRSSDWSNDRLSDWGHDEPAWPAGDTPPDATHGMGGEGRDGGEESEGGEERGGSPEPGEESEGGEGAGGAEQQEADAADGTSAMEPSDEPVAVEPGEPGPPTSEPVDEPAPEVWDTRRFGDRRRPTTAEQAVPWLVGLVLALAGIVIVLLVLIFADANGGFASVASPSAGPSLGFTPAPTGTPLPVTTASPAPSASATPAPTPAPTYGALEMDYLRRPGGTSASELLRNDFSANTPEVVVEHASTDIAHYALAPDGTVAAAIVGGQLLALQHGKSSRKLASNVAGVTFGTDASTVFAVQITTSGSTDTATVLSIDFASGKSTTLTTITMPHPATVSRSHLSKARFFDDGGADRLYATSDGNLVLWIDQAGQWRIDPVSGSNIPVTRQPVLWSPDGTRRIAASASGSTTTLKLVDASGATIATTRVSGLISHLRWSPDGKKVVFTAGLAFASGGVRQDLWLWTLGSSAPRQLTTGGASWGADWLGVAQFWQP